MDAVEKKSRTARSPISFYDPAQAKFIRRSVVVFNDLRASGRPNPSGPWGHADLSKSMASLSLGPAAARNTLSAQMETA